MACCLKEDDAKRLAEKKTKGDKDEESNKMNLNPTVKKLIKDRQAEVEKIYEACKGVCLIEVSLELELEQRDMQDALEIDDVHQLVDIFPALTKANSQRLLDILKARKTEFEQTLANGEQVVVEMNFNGYGIHCGEGWIVADVRLLENVTQIQNATVTFLDGTGADKKEIKFEPNERLSFHVFLKQTALRTCSATHPGLAFFKLGVQSSPEETAGDDSKKLTEWESAEQQLLDDAKLPVFRLPLFNDLEVTKKYSIVQLGQGADGKLDRTISLIDDMDIVPTMGNRPGTFFMQMKVKNLEKYLPCKPRGGVAFSQDGDLFTLCGFVLPADDGLAVAEGAEVPQEEFLPLHGDTLTIFSNAKNFIYNRTGQALTEGQSIMFNYQMMAEFAKDLLIKSLGPTFDINFIFPTYDEKFVAGHSMDVSGYFASEAAKGSG